MLLRERFTVSFIGLFIGMVCTPSRYAYAGYYYDFNPTCRKAYAEIIQLKLLSGAALI